MDETQGVNEGGTRGKWMKHKGVNEGSTREQWMKHKGGMKARGGRARGGNG